MLPLLLLACSAVTQTSLDELRRAMPPSEVISPLDGWVGEFSGRMRSVDLTTGGFDRLKIDIASDPAAVDFRMAWGTFGGEIYWEWGILGGTEGSRAYWSTGDGGWLSLNWGTLSATLDASSPPGLELAPSFALGYNNASYRDMIANLPAGFIADEADRFASVGLAPIRVRVQVQSLPTIELALSLEPKFDYQPVRVYHVHEDLLAVNHEVKKYTRVGRCYAPVESRHFVYLYDGYGHFGLPRQALEYHLHSGVWRRVPALAHFVGTRRLPSGVLVYDGFARNQAIAADTRDRALRSMLNRLREVPLPSEASAAGSTLDWLSGLGAEEQWDTTSELIGLSDLQAWLKDRCGAASLAVLLSHLDRPFGDLPDALAGHMDLSAGALCSRAAAAGVPLHVRDTGVAVMPDLGPPFIALLGSKVRDGAVGHFVCAIPDRDDGLWRIIDFARSVRLVRPGEALVNWDGIMLCAPAWDPTWPSGSAHFRSARFAQPVRVILGGLGGAIVVLALVNWRRRRLMVVTKAAVAVLICAPVLGLFSCAQESSAAHVGSYKLVPYPAVLTLAPATPGPVSGQVRLVNDEAHPIWLSGTKSTCGCTVAIPATSIVAPGEEIAVLVTIDRPGMPIRTTIEFLGGGVEDSLSPGARVVLASLAIECVGPWEVVFDPPIASCEYGRDGTFSIKGGRVHIFPRTAEFELVTASVNGCALPFRLGPGKSAETADGDRRVTFDVALAGWSSDLLQQPFLDIEALVNGVPTKLGRWPIRITQTQE